MAVILEVPLARAIGRKVALCYKELMIIIIIVIVLNKKIPNNNFINIMITAAEGSSGTGERLRFCVSRKLISNA